MDSLDATTRSVRKASVAAGIALLLLAVLAGFGFLVVVEGLVTQGDAAETAKDILASEGLFRLGVVAMLVAASLDVIVGWGLFRVFSPVNRDIALVAALFRVVYAGVFIVAISQLVSIPDLLRGDGHLQVFSEAQLQAEALVRVDTFTDIWDAGLFLFSAHLVLIGYLAYRSGYVHKVLGALLVVAGGGYMIDSLVSFLSEGRSPDFSAYTFIGEFFLILWLLIRGRRVTLRDEDAVPPGAQASVTER